MIKEYIDKLLSDNNEELNRLEKQMKSLLNDLKNSQQLMEKLQREKNLDINIFSPRNFNYESKEKMEEARQNIDKIKQEIEYVRDLIETHVQKKYEYEGLLKEISSDVGENVEENTAEIDMEIPEETENEVKENETKAYVVDTSLKTKLENAFQLRLSSSEENSQTSETKVEVEQADDSLISTEDTKTESNELNSKDFSIEYDELMNFLSDLYSKTEVSLATLVADKNRCKKELKNIKSMIKAFAEKIENN